MKAQEAREITKKNKKTPDIELALAFSRIKESAEKGFNSCHVHYESSSFDVDELEKALEKNGYVVTTNTWKEMTSLSTPAVTLYIVW